MTFCIQPNKLSRQGLCCYGSCFILKCHGYILSCHIPAVLTSPVLITCSCPDGFHLCLIVGPVWVYIRPCLCPHRAFDVSGVLWWCVLMSSGGFVGHWCLFSSRVFVFVGVTLFPEFWALISVTFCGRLQFLCFWSVLSFLPVCCLLPPLPDTLVRFWLASSALCFLVCPAFFSFVLHSKHFWQCV